MMINAWKSAMVIAALGLAAGCYRNDTRTLVVKVEGMNGEVCFEAIRKNLQRLNPDNKRVHEITPDYTAQTVTVVFSGRDMAIKNVEYAIAEAGFKANDLEPRGEPPANCQAGPVPSPTPPAPAP